MLTYSRRDDERAGDSSHSRWHKDGWGTEAAYLAMGLVALMLGYWWRGTWHLGLVLGRTVGHCNWPVRRVVLAFPGRAGVVRGGAGVDSR